MRIADHQYAGARGMWLSAKAHCGRYYLRPNYRHFLDEEPPLYKAARWLVNHGYARWLDATGPGIMLTAKPWP